MSPFAYFTGVFQKYALFTGRARRAEYWWFVLFNILISYGLLFIGLYVLRVSWLSNLYSLAALVPGIAVSVRRMHDVNKSGWFILIPFYNLILAATEGTRGPNEYGPDPKGSPDAFLTDSETY